MGVCQVQTKQKKENKHTKKQTNKQTNKKANKQANNKKNKEFTCVAGVSLGGRGGCVRHSRAQEDGRVIHIDLETVYVALVQVVYLKQRPTWLTI